MKRTHIAAIVLTALLLLPVFSCFASAAEIRPIPIDHDSLDLGNGSFRLLVRGAWQAANNGRFTAVLYLEDRYDGEQIRAMMPGDTVWANDQKWTVKEVIVHSEDRVPGTEADYEIYPEEPLDGYLAFQPREDGTYVAVMNDWNPLVLAGNVQVNLPLPDAFVYLRDGEASTADRFVANLSSLTNPYCTCCEFKDGQLIRVGEDSYPQGPAEAETGEFQPMPVWKFFHGFRDGLDTAVISACDSSCEEGPLPVEISPEEAEKIRRLAMNGTVVKKANEMSVTGGTRIYTFTTPGGVHLLSIEIFEGLAVGSDGMYEYVSETR